MVKLTKILLAAMLLSAFTVALYASAQKPGSANAGEKDSPNSTLPATADPGYVIGASDLLSINVWKEPELSVIVPVRPDGKISLPLLNDVDAAGVTPMALTASLTEKLKKFVTDPRVSVTVKEINSQRVYILGQVARPGAFPLLPQMTVLQALSAAGGFVQYADQKKIYVLRTANGKQVKLPFNYKEVVRGANSDQNVVLQPGDTIVVP
jgi:polysaccharide biosynthesis/export protein